MCILLLLAIDVLPNDDTESLKDQNKILLKPERISSSDYLQASITIATVALICYLSTKDQTISPEEAKTCAETEKERKRQQELKRKFEQDKLKQEVKAEANKQQAEANRKLKLEREEKAEVKKQQAEEKRLAEADRKLKLKLEQEAKEAEYKAAEEAKLKLKLEQEAKEALAMIKKLAQHSINISDEEEDEEGQEIRSKNVIAAELQQQKVLLQELEDKNLTSLLLKNQQESQDQIENAIKQITTQMKKIIDKMQELKIKEVMIPVILNKLNNLFTTCDVYEYCNKYIAYKQNILQLLKRAINTAERTIIELTQELNQSDTFDDKDIKDIEQEIQQDINVIQISASEKLQSSLLTQQLPTAFNLGDDLLQLLYRNLENGQPITTGITINRFLQYIDANLSLDKITNQQIKLEVQELQGVLTYMYTGESTLDDASKKTILTRLFTLDGLNQSTLNSNKLSDDYISKFLNILHNQIATKDRASLLTNLQAAIVLLNIINQNLQLSDNVKAKLCNLIFYTFEHNKSLFELFDEIQKIFDIYEKYKLVGSNYDNFEQEILNTILTTIDPVLLSQLNNKLEKQYYTQQLQKLHQCVKNDKQISDEDKNIIQTSQNSKQIFKILYKYYPVLFNATAMGWDDVENAYYHEFVATIQRAFINKMEQKAHSASIKKKIEKVKEDNEQTIQIYMSTLSPEMQDKLIKVMYPSILKIQEERINDLLNFDNVIVAVAEMLNSKLNLNDFKNMTYNTITQQRDALQTTKQRNAIINTLCC